MPKSALKIQKQDTSRCALSFDMSEVSYSRKNDEIECVHYVDCTKEYAPHTHANHLIVGYVEDGNVLIVLDGECIVCGKGDEFKIAPNVLHELKSADGRPYSVMVLCIRTEAKAADSYLQELQDTILEKPENIYLVEEMAKDSKISPYHMIRKFKKAFGLTPHQFQIQSKVRKAQRLLEQNKSIADVTYEAGFCDQSHMDRCFQKVLNMTPGQYQEAISPTASDEGGEELREQI